MTQSIRSLDELQATVAQWRKAGEHVALVPTMGALHEGHLSLVKAAQAKAERVVVSIFVNPTQFGPNEDFHKYPRPLDQDLTLLEKAGADAVWLPSVEVMYPAGFATSIHVAGVSEGLCGASRPGHFDGVATVVAKLLLQAMPDIALFGEKDYQQLSLIKRLVKDLNIPISILGVPTLREKDGLAMSSRNRYLSPEERVIAPQLHAALQEAAGKLKQGGETSDILTAAEKQILAAGFTRLDYLELRSEDTLAPMDAYNAPARLLAAAWLGSTRLIDNVKVE